MANIRQLDKRRKSVKNVRKITRTMELIATARFKKAMDRAAAATDYTKRITSIVQDIANSGTDVSHALLTAHDSVDAMDMLVLTANRGLCGGYNGSVVRAATVRRNEIKKEIEAGQTRVSGKRGISALRFAGIPIEKTYTEFDDQPSFAAVAKIADELIERYISGKIDRVDIAYTKFITISKQTVVVETLLPFASLAPAPNAGGAAESVKASGTRDIYEFLPSASAHDDEPRPDRQIQSTDLASQTRGPSSSSAFMVFICAWEIHKRNAIGPADHGVSGGGGERARRAGSGAAASARRQGRGGHFRRAEAVAQGDAQPRRALRHRVG